MSVTPVNDSLEVQEMPERRGLGGRLPKILLVLGGMLALLAVWQLSTQVLKVPPYILPSPENVLVALKAGLFVPLDSPIGFYKPLASTLANAGWGFLIGAVLGLVLGSLMAEFKAAETLLMPYAFALQTLPKVAIAPLIVIWCGFGDGSKITMAALLAFFPMMVNTFAGIRTTESDRLDLMRTLSASRIETYLFVKLPTAAPYIFAGIEMGIVYALLGAIVAEFLGAQSGIGVTITQAQAVTDVASVFAALLLLGTVGITMHLIVRAIERKLIHWNRNHR